MEGLGEQAADGPGWTGDGDGDGGARRTGGGRSGDGDDDGGVRRTGGGVPVGNSRR